MKRTLIALGAGIAMLGLGGCAEGYYDQAGGGVYYEHSPSGYDGFYDDFYGPFYDGYWGDGGFWYSTGEGRPYQLDRDNHFRHEGWDGGHAFHGGMRMGGGHGGDHDGRGRRP